MKKKSWILNLSAIAMLVMITGCGSEASKADKEEQETVQANKKNQEAFDDAKDDIHDHKFYQAKDLLEKAKKDKALEKKANTLITQIDNYEQSKTLLDQDKNAEAKKMADKVIDTKDTNKTLKKMSQQIIKVANEREKLEKEGDVNLAKAQDAIQNKDFYTAKLYLEQAQKDKGLKNKSEAIMTQIDNYQAAQNAWEQGKTTQSKALAGEVADIEDGSQEMIYLATNFIEVVNEHIEEQKEAQEKAKEQKENKKKEKEEQASDLEASEIATAKDDIVREDFYAARQSLREAMKNPDHKKEAVAIDQQINDYLEAKDNVAQGKISKAKENATKVTQVSGGFDVMDEYARELYQQLNREAKEIKVQKNERLALTQAEDMIDKQDFYSAKQYLKIAVKDPVQKQTAVAINTQINEYIKAQQAYNKGHLKVARSEAKKVQEVERGFGQMTAYADALIRQIDAQTKK